MKKILSTKPIIFLAIFILGALWAASLRFILLVDTSVHYHANFAVFVDGQRDPFDSFTFYEEVTACSPDHSGDPASRAHMHDQVSDVVHVHDEAVTWAHFFNNLGYNIGADTLQTISDTYVTQDDGPELRYVLNGQLVRGRTLSISVIGNEDVLLVDYSADDEDVLMGRYAQIEASASDYNERPDPASCSGSEGDSLGDRIKRTFSRE